MQIPYRPFLPVAFSTLLAIAACKKKDDPQPPATPGPSNDPRAAYTGSWLVTDSLWIAGMPYDPPFTTYVLSITTGGTASDTLYFNNMWNQGAAYYALLAGANFSFPSQNVSGPYDMYGSGNFNGSQLFYETMGDKFLHRGHGQKQ